MVVTLTAWDSINKESGFPGGKMGLSEDAGRRQHSLLSFGWSPWPELKVGVSTKKVWPSPSEETRVGSLVLPVNCPQPHTKTDPHTCALGPALAGGRGVPSKKAQLTAIPHPGHTDSVPLS